MYFRIEFTPAVLLSTLLITPLAEASEVEQTRPVSVDSAEHRICDSVTWGHTSTTGAFITQFIRAGERPSNPQNADWIGEGRLVMEVETDDGFCLTLNLDGGVLVEDDGTFRLVEDSRLLVEIEGDVTPRRFLFRPDEVGAPRLQLPDGTQAELEPSMHAWVGAALGLIPDAQEFTNLMDRRRSLGPVVDLDREVDLRRSGSVPDTRAIGRTERRNSFAARQPVNLIEVQNRIVELDGQINALRSQYDPYGSNQIEIIAYEAKRDELSALLASAVHEEGRHSVLRQAALEGRVPTTEDARRITQRMNEIDTRVSERFEKIRSLVTSN